jgi:hypothetical protein
MSFDDEFLICVFFPSLPEYNTSFTFNPCNRGQVFLSICVYESEDTPAPGTTIIAAADKVAKSQLYRVDVPLRMRKELKVLLRFTPAAHTASLIFLLCFTHTHAPHIL